MNTKMSVLSKRNAILTTPLREQSVQIDGWPDGLIIRELTGKSGAALIKMCSDDKGNIDQDKLVAGVILATLRDGDEPEKPLIFGKESNPNEYDPAYKDGLMAGGLGHVMQAAMASIDLSGLNQAAAKDQAKTTQARQ
jgi:hypothetical protein